MAKKLGNLTRFSFLLVLIVGYIFLFAQTFSENGLFSQNTENWNKFLSGYLIIFALTLIGSLIFAKETITQLAKADYWKAFISRFLPSAAVSFVILILLKVLIKGPGSIDILSAVSYISLPVLVFHLFVVSQIEEILFGGLMFTALEKKSGKLYANIIVVILFALFHYSKAGGSWAILLTYIPLRLIFNYARNNGLPLLNRVSPRLFGATPQTQQSNAGVHFAWNLFVIGFG
jgi:membrane protease YdiL (CAAX protease family)